MDTLRNHSYGDIATKAWSYVAKAVDMTKSCDPSNYPRVKRCRGLHTTGSLTNREEYEEMRAYNRAP